MVLVYLLGASCGVDKDTQETAEPPSPWHLDAAQLGDAMLLGAWEHQGELLIVGGNLTDGGGDVLRWDGSTLCREDDVTEKALWWIHSDGATVVMVGEQGTVLVNGERRDINTEATLFGVWVEGEEILAVGGSVAENTGEIWRWTGTEWEALLTGTDGLVFKVYEEHIVGDGVAWSWNGETLVEVANEERLVTVYEDVAVGGQQGPVVLDWDGNAWISRTTTWLGQPLNGVHVGETTTWVTGMFGVMAYYEDGWRIPDFPLSSEHFHSVRIFQGEVWFLGGNFLSGGTYGTIARYGEKERSITLQDCELSR